MVDCSFNKTLVVSKMLFFSLLTNSNSYQKEYIVWELECLAEEIGVKWRLADVGNNSWLYSS